MDSTKRENPVTEEQEQPQPKRLKHPSHHPSDSHLNSRVVINPADCNLDFNIGTDGLTGHALCEEGFAYCWSGARGSVGITGGKYYFGCRVVSDQPVKMEDTPFDQQNVCRIGISRGDDPVGNLGETEHSFGFGGTRKFSNASKFVDYGERFGTGDTIICLVDLESKPWGAIEFCKNGRRLGIAKHFDASLRGLGVIDSSAQNLPWETALFPHVLLKNTVVEMQFSTEDGLLPMEGYKPWASAMKDEKAIIGPPLVEPRDLEVIMMVGLPASGKSTWAEKWVKEHPEKRYVLLGTNLVLDQMKVPGLLRKHNYGERFDRLMDQATKIFNTLLSRASKVPRNYIIDQTNVYKSARKRKLKPFAFCHKVAVVVFPRAEELKLRSEKRFGELGKDVPPEAVNEMLANFVLPTSGGAGEYFDQIIYTDLDRFEAQQQLDEMKRALPLSSSDRPRSDYSAYSRESSALSDSGLSTYSLPGPGRALSRYSDASMGVGGVAEGCPWRGSTGPAPLTCPTNVNTGYMHRGSVGVQPYQTNVNASFDTLGSSYDGNSNPVPGRDAHQGPYRSHTTTAPREDFTSYVEYVHDPHNIQRYGPRAVFMSTPEGTSSANQSSYDAPHGSQNQSPYGHQNPGYQGQYGATPYGHPEATTPANQSYYGPLYGTPRPSPYGHHDPNSDGQYGATLHNNTPSPSPYGHHNPNSDGQHGATIYNTQGPSPYGHHNPNSHGQYGHPNPGSYASNPSGVPPYPGPGGTAQGPTRYY